MKILIADDDPIQRRTLKADLGKWGYDVVTAADGDEAWSMLQDTEAPKIAILDWIMPGLDGVEICRKVREQAGSSYTYLLLLTSNDTKKHILQGMEAGADDFITKPFDIDELRVRLRAGLRILSQEEALIQALNDHKRTNDTLEQERNLLRNLIDNIPDHVYVKDTRERYVEVNVAHLRLLGAMSRDEVLGRKTCDFLTDDLPIEQNGDIEECLQSGQPLYDREEMVEDWMGLTRHLSTTALPLWDSRGQIIGLIYVSRDMSHIKRNEGPHPDLKQTGPA